MPEPSKLKVCFLAGTLGRGGAERQLVYTLRALADADVSVRVLCLTRGEAFEKEITDIGVPVEWIGESRLKPLRLASLIRSLRREPADILQSAHFYTNIYAGAAARALRLPAIGAIRSDLVSEFKANGVLSKWQLSLPHHLIANTTVARQRAIQFGVAPERVHFVPNAVDTANFVKGEYRNGNHPIRILFAGRLIEAKRLDRFMRVFLRAAQALPGREVKAVVAGHGPLRNQMEDAARRQGLGPDRFEFIGEQSDMRGVYGGADFLMLTSDWEGTPNVLLEAMASGLPVVATRVGGVQDIVGEDRGFVLEPTDEDGLAHAALRLAGEAGLRKTMGRCGNEYVARQHSLNALQVRLLEIYRRVSKQ